VRELKDAGAEAAIAIPMDLTEQATLAPGVEQVVQAFGGIDIFVGNTGGPEANPFLNVPRQGWEQALNESFLPMVDLCHAILPHMQANKWGRIIFITTVGVKIVQPNMVLSDSIRLATVGLAKSLSIEFAHEGIMVNCLCPGPFATDRMEYLVECSMRIDGLSRADAEAVWLAEVPVKKFGDPKDFGAMVAMLASERAGFITGAAIAHDGGKSRAY
jgi:3-oxoacyl-[acyl-carrier protein] reductase